MAPQDIASSPSLTSLSACVRVKKLARRSLHPDRDIEHDGHGVDVEPRVPPVPGDAAVIASKEGHIGAASCAESSASTAVSDSDGFEQFNLEKHLKGIVRQYVSFLVIYGVALTLLYASEWQS